MRQILCFGGLPSLKLTAKDPENSNGWKMKPSELGTFAYFQYGQNLSPMICGGVHICFRPGRLFNPTNLSSIRSWTYNSPEMKTKCVITVFQLAPNHLFHPQRFRFHHVVLVCLVSLLEIVAKNISMTVGVFFFFSAFLPGEKSHSSPKTSNMCKKLHGCRPCCWKTSNNEFPHFVIKQGCCWNEDDLEFPCFSVTNPARCLHVSY